MSVDRREEQYTDGDDEVRMPPESEYNDSSEGVGGFASDEDDGDEEVWVKDQNREKVGCRLGLENVSKASDGLLFTTHLTSLSLTLLLVSSTPTLRA
jgi:hypothetical protein